MFLDQQAQNEIKSRFANLVNPVKIINFTQTLECQYCKETRQILEELAALSDKLTLEVYNFVSDKEMVGKYSIDKIPATVIATDEIDYGIRYSLYPGVTDKNNILSTFDPSTYDPAQAPTCSAAAARHTAKCGAARCASIAAWSA